jgi:hypothetical protein
MLGYVSMVQKKNTAVNVSKKKKAPSVKHAQKSSQKKSFAFPYGVLAIVVVIVVLLIIIFSGNKLGPEQVASCLVEKGYTMAGASWCSHCADQKALFKGAFEDIIIPQGAYKDCEVDVLWCQEKGIEGYPTWVTPTGNLIPGTQSLATLAKIAECK